MSNETDPTGEGAAPESATNDEPKHRETNRRSAAVLRGVPTPTERRCDRTLQASGGKCGMYLLSDGLCPRCQPRTIAAGPEVQNASGRVA